ncbi:MAG: division/cell wall cluster transcriptional repressor MraZ [Acidimicrobiia bacterium]
MELRRARFVGTFEHGLDDKGRMVLPAKVRAQLGETGVLAKLDGCLGLWTQEGFDRVADQLADHVAEGRATAAALRVFMADAAEVTPDQQGRVVIPQRLRAYAALGRDVVITGRIDRAEIWDASRWAGLATEGDADLAQAVAALRI